jgi:ABC-type sugar transport system ATPase subunit
MMPVLEATNLTLVHGATRVLDGLSLSIAAGEVVVVAGPSGSGKTTLLRVLLGLVPPDTGTVRQKGRTVSEGGRILVPPEDRDLAVVFQDLALWPHLTVRDNLAFGLNARGIPSEIRTEKIRDALLLVGLANHADRYPGQLSGGERQRVAIARALVLDPEAIFFDEPLSNLDVALKSELLVLLRKLLHEERRTAIYVTHDPREAVLLADRIAVLEQGMITQLGTLEELRTAPATRFVQAFVEEMRRGRSDGA